jgi:hypothetical protein
MDNKVEVELGGFAPQPRQPSQYEYERADARKTASVFGENISNLMTGDASKMESAKNYFEAIPNVESVVKNKDVITVTTRNKDGESVTQSISLNPNNARNTGQALAKLLNVDKLPEDMVSGYVNRFNSNKKINLVDSFKGGKTIQGFDVPVNAGGVGSKY